MANTAEKSIQEIRDSQSRVSTIREAINTPQIILGRNNGNIFDTFDDSESVTSWYKKAISSDHEAVFLSTIENSDILEFSYNINAGGASREQHQVVIKVLDPTNTFEDRFFSFFSMGSKSYSDWISSIGHRSISRETTGLRVTFGETDDPKKWAPVQSCELIYINYELGSDSARTFTLTFVPSAGMAALDVTPGEEDSATGNLNKSYHIEGTFIDSSKKDELRVEESPQSLVLSIIKDTFANLTKVPTFLIVQKSIEEALNRLWTAASVNATKNYIANKKRAIVRSGNKNTESFAELFNKIFGKIEKGRISDASGISVDLKGGIADRNKLSSQFTQGGSVGGPVIDEIQDELGYQQEGWEEKLKKERQAIVDSAHKAFGGRNKRIPFMEGSRRQRMDDLAAATGKATHVVGKAAAKELDPGRYKLNSYAQNLFINSKLLPKGHWFLNDWFPLNDEEQERSNTVFGKKGNLGSGKKAPEPYFLTFDYGTEVARRVAKAKFIEAGMAGKLDTKTKEQVFKRGTGIELSDAVTVTGLKIDKVEVYQIYLQAAYEFFQNLGFRVYEDLQVPNGKGPNNMVTGDPSLTGDSGRDVRKLLEETIVDIYVRLVGKSRKEIVDKALSILSKINSDNTFITQVFSESKLCELVLTKTVAAGIPFKGDGEFDRFTLVSTGVAYSNITGKEENKDFKPADINLYTALHEAFTKFRGELNPEVIKSDILHSFTYGYINSDILNFNFDLRPWYGYLINNVIPSIATNGLLGRNATEHNLFGSIASYYKNNKDTKGKDLRGIISDWYDLYSEPGADSSIFSETAPMVNFALTQPRGPNRKDFIDSVMLYLDFNFSEIENSQSLIVDPIQKSSALDNILAIRDKVSKLTFTGEIETLPYYKFMSAANSLMSKININFKEPDIKTNDFMEKGPPSTWLSGEWTIQGLGFNVSQGKVSTSFNIVKNYKVEN
jgi:hypothetical protein